jgi:hypothetical protein
MRGAAGSVRFGPGNGQVAMIPTLAGVTVGGGGAACRTVQATSGRDDEAAGQELWPRDGGPQTGSRGERAKGRCQNVSFGQEWPAGEPASNDPGQPKGSAGERTGNRPAILTAALSAGHDGGKCGWESAASE